jgi:hypothetical protein
MVSGQISKVKRCIDSQSNFRPNNTRTLQTFFHRVEKGWKKMKKELKTDSTLVFSYLTLRKAIGVLGCALPFAVSLGALVIFRTGIQSSISSYYYTGTRDVLVGTLWAIGFFLLSYRGYEPIDNIAGNLAFVFALGVSLFPTAPDLNPSHTATVIGYIHQAFAGLFFLTLIFFSVYLFTKTNPNGQPTRRKLQRNIVYRGCGIIMAISILLMTIYTFLPDSSTASLEAHHPIFWLETIAILAFGISWLTKGEAILPDQVNPG